MVSSAFRSWTLGVSIGLLTAAGMASAQSGIGYTSVAAALTDLKTRAGATVTVQGGWTIVDDPANSTIWSFAPPDHAAYPAVIKRTVFERDGQVMIEMRGLCQATKAPCDALTEEFMQMTEQTKKSLVPKAAPVSSGWAPSAEQASDAAALLARFHGAIDAGRYQEAHALLTPGMQAEIPLGAICGQ